MSRKKLGGRIVKNLILTVISLFCVFPLFWMVVAATNPSAKVLSGTLIPGTILIMEC